jgi:hypothetical protein
MSLPHNNHNWCLCETVSQKRRSFLIFRISYYWTGGHLYMLLRTGVRWGERRVQYQGFVRGCGITRVPWLPVVIGVIVVIYLLLTYPPCICSPTRCEHACSRRFHLGCLGLRGQVYQKSHRILLVAKTEVVREHFFWLLELYHDSVVLNHAP